MSTISDLETKVQRLTDELWAAKDELTAAKIEASPVKIGQIYSRTIKRGWGAKEKTIVQRAEVVGHRHMGATPVLRIFKADGSLGSRESWLPGHPEWEIAE